MFTVQLGLLDDKLLDTLTIYVPKEVNTNSELSRLRVTYEYGVSFNPFELFRTRQGSVAIKKTVGTQK